MKQPICIFPYSGTGKEALDCFNENQYCDAFISDDENYIGKSYCGIPIISKLDLGPNKNISLVHGSPTSFLKREQVIKEFK